MQIPIPVQSTSSVAVNFDKILKKTQKLFMGTADLQALFALSPAERIELAEDLWDSVAQDATGHALKVHEIAEIDQRLSEHQTHPHKVVAWETVKGNLGLS